MRKSENLIGQKFGRLTVKERIGKASKWLILRLLEVVT